MKWTEDLSTGIELIDDQHKELFNRINDLVAAIKEHTCKYKIGDVVTFLDEYIIFHFGEEERFMQKHKYPHYARHKAQHTKFIDSFNALKKKLQKIESRQIHGSYDLSVETNQVVVDWILDHIVKIDKELGAFLKTIRLEN